MRRQKVMAWALAVAVTGCAGGGTMEEPRAPGAQEWVLEVQNHNWQDATVYAVNGSVRQRLGLVSTHQSRRFTLPEAAVRAGEVRLLVDLIGSSARYITPPIQVRRGDVIAFDVENHLPMSSYLVMGQH